MIPAGNYLLFGRTGVGKSSLVNTIANAPIALKDKTYACSKSIAKYSFATPCGFYTIYDSPGLSEDENPITDKNYIAQLNIFLSDPEIQHLEISIILTVRSDNTRIRSEDFDVINYLAQLLSWHPHIPVLLVATWVEWDKQIKYTFQPKLDILRIQYLLMLDKALLSICNRELCFHGFSGSYAVDNTLGAWFTSWQPCYIESNFHSSFLYLEEIVGHKVQFICEWIDATGHSSEFILKNKLFQLVEGRILNLTKYPLDHVSQAHDLLRITPQSFAHSPCFPEKAFIFPIVSTSLAIAIDKVNKLIQKRFRMRVSLDARAILKDLSDNLRLSTLYLQKLSEGQGLPLHISKHIVLLLSAREVLFGLHYIACKRSMFLHKPELIVERIFIIRQILADLFSRLGDTFLARELRLFVELSLDFPFDSNFRLVTQHLMNTSSMLSLAVSFAELTHFPCTIRLYDLVCPDPGLYPLVDLLNSNFCLLGYSRDMLNSLEDLDWSEIADLAEFEPQCMRFLLEDILFSLQKKQWFVRGFRCEIILRKSVDIYPTQNESYWPSWRNEEEDLDLDPYNDDGWPPY